jgi:hypothetical protein
MAADLNEARALREATELFVGRGRVIGVGLSNENLHTVTVFLEQRDPVQEREIRGWAKKYRLGVDFVLAGKFTAGSQA